MQAITKIFNHFTILQYVNFSLGKPISNIKYTLY